MFKTFFTCIALATVFTLSSSAVDVNAGVSVGTGGTRYHTYGGYTEGTISTIGKDGRFTIRGTTSPYARDYVTYHSGYWSTPESARVTYSTPYRDRFTYTYDDSNLTDYTYTVPDYDKVVVYDEPNYGTDFTTWTYTEPRVYHYGDLRVGDRVVVGVDNNNARAIYRVRSHK